MTRSERMTALWADPDFRARQKAGLASRAPRRRKDVVEAERAEKEARKAERIRKNGIIEQFKADNGKIQVVNVAWRSCLGGCGRVLPTGHFKNLELNICEDCAEK
jgi:hypothetical protein